MLVTLNDQGNIESGYLRVKDKINLTIYRNNLLEKSTDNFTISKKSISKKLQASKHYKEKLYSEGDKVVHERLINPLKNTVPFEVYQFLYDIETIECKNLITIQILTRALSDWYKVEKNEIIKHFIQCNIMELLYPIKGSSLQVPDPRESHKEMHKLLEPNRQKDLVNFQNSLNFLEYYICKEFSIKGITTLSEEEIRDYSLDTPLNEIVTNSQILFGTNPIQKVKSLSKYEVVR